MLCSCFPESGRDWILDLRREPRLLASSNSGRGWFPPHPGSPCFRNSVISLSIGHRDLPPPPDSSSRGPRETSSEPLANELLNV
ncbi:hypothetical protein NL676_009323 [Syzygium grande]|nr:hypothetical protein NL676_009323 [Syzygium grande]